MTEYSVQPRATTAPFEPVVVALVAATTKTVIQVTVPTTTAIRILGWGVSFDGASGTAVPVIAHMGAYVASTAATVTAFTPDPWGNPQNPASLCVGGTTATGYNASAEGTLTSTLFQTDSQHVHPQSGYAVWFPEAHQPAVISSATAHIRIRCKAPAGVNVLPWIVWTEPVV